jgi:Tfp pilus assembly protein FimT
MIGYVPQQQAFSIPQNVQQHELAAADIEEIEMGYDGGQSSFFTSNSNGDFSNSSLNGELTQRQGIDPEESSLGEDNVLGLLYYAGASSAEEEENSQSASRVATRMKRRNSLSSSSRQTRTSARSRRSSTSGKSKSSSSKSKSSHSRRRQKLSLNKVDEDHDYDYHREEYFNSQLYQRDEPSISESFPRHQIQTHLPQSGCSVSVSTVSDDEDIMKFNRQRSVGTTITEDKSLDADDLFT